LKKQQQPIRWKDIQNRRSLKLYAGDIFDQELYGDVVGLSLSRNDDKHILHDMTYKIPLQDNLVESFQSEDVFEHIVYEKLIFIINEIYRTLKPGHLFRLSLPDYRCDVLYNRSVKDSLGNIVFDPGGGGSLNNPGHLWFPRLETVRALIEQTFFYTNGNVEYLHYYNVDNTFVLKPIDYSKGHVSRTPDFDDRVANPRRPMSMVIDLTKFEPNA